MLIKFSTLAFAATLLSVSPQLLSARSTQDIPADTPISNLLAEAQAHLSRGEANEALVYFDAAVARDPNDYLTLFKRATTYLSVGRAAQATEDLNKALKLKPGFKGAHLQLSGLKAKSAQWDEAREHLLRGGRKPDGEEFEALLQAQGAAGLAESAEAAGNWDECVNQSGAAIVVASRSLPLREMRARCRFARGEMEEGLGDLRHVLQMRPGDVSPYLKMSAITFYALGDLNGGLTHARKCLQSDPDSKICRKLLKQEKAAEKTMARVEKAYEGQRWMTGAMLLAPTKDEPGLIAELTEEIRALEETGTLPTNAPKALLAKLKGLACQGYYEAENRKAEAFCKDALEADGNSLYGLLHQAKVQQEKELYDAAIASLNKAAEQHPDQRNKIHPLLQEAQIILKRSKMKDYYKVLGIARDSDARQIKSAYRRLSKQHHPDKAAKLGVTKEEAEKKMASINEAYEVLSDPELRARFDRGDDPNSQEGQNPFQGSPFGGGMPFVFNQRGHSNQHFQFDFGGGGGGGFPFGG